MVAVQTLQERVCKARSKNGGVFKTPRDQDGIRVLMNEDDEIPEDIGLIHQTLPQAIEIAGARGIENDPPPNRVVLAVVDADGYSTGLSTQLIRMSELLEMPDLAAGLDLRFGH